jgi:hypothetical protein
MSISQFINLLIKRLSPSVLMGLAVVGLVAGLAVAFALTPDGGTLWVAEGGAINEKTALVPVDAATGVPGRAVAYLPGGPVAVGL